MKTTVKEYIDERIAQLHELTNIKFQNIKDSIGTAYVSMERRLDTMNEFRDTLRDQASRFVTDDKLASCIQSIKKELDTVHDFMVSHNAKASQVSVIFVGVISAIGLLISVIALIKDW
jgi:hypothetical protein